jgi:membrane protein required for beta-lactamase induction
MLLEIGHLADNFGGWQFSLIIIFLYVVLPIVTLFLLYWVLADLFHKITRKKKK